MEDHMEDHIRILNGYQIDPLQFTRFYLSNRNFFIDSAEHFKNYFELNSSGIFAAASAKNGEIIGIKVP